MSQSHNDKKQQLEATAAQQQTTPIGRLTSEDADAEVVTVEVLHILAEVLVEEIGHEVVHLPSSLSVHPDKSTSLSSDM